MTDNSNHPFDSLTPDLLIDAVEAQGFVSDGRFIVLNSYENRVYQIGIEDQVPMIAKFYRPQRWTDQQIQEEHDFCFDLQAQELPVVCPWVNPQGKTINHYADFSFALYPRKGGHAPELDNLDNLFILGRLLGRFHAIGATRPFEHRPSLDVESFGRRSYELISAQFIPSELSPAYDSLALDLLARIDDIVSDFGAINSIRVHGDCHSGNILWRDDNPHFVDFDDARMAPAVQDLWMLLSGDRQEQSLQMAELIEGYNEFHNFDFRELQLIEVLRTLRIMHHSAWIARRWSDPAFPRAFSWFDSPRYWSEHILMLREQLAALNEPPLQVIP
ncbi:MAG: serine/threonine protein kinase [Porticoccaceae bacterium]|jgi:Ser/Thr protein kinase RdoA (MazF antagonist)